MAYINGNDVAYGVLNGEVDAYTKAETDALLDRKADKETTLSGYGITDAYTKAETDQAIEDGAEEYAEMNIDPALANHASILNNHGQRLTTLERVTSDMVTTGTTDLTLTQDYASESDKILNGKATFSYTRVSNRVIFDISVGLMNITASTSNPYMVELEELPFTAGSIFDTPYYDFSNGGLAVLARGRANSRALRLYVYKDYQGNQVNINGVYRIKES